MTVCENCGESLDAEWKYCIHCGTKVQPQDAAMPGAIRPTTVAPTPRRRLDWQLALGLFFAVAGAAMIIFLVVVLIVPHGQ